MSFDWQINTFAQVPSTQDYVRELAEEGLPEGIVVQSLVQTKGRGRQGREWHSPMGNLYMSLLLRPCCPAPVAGQMSFVVAVAVSRAMDLFLADGHSKTLKWPNDILIDGKKCAGILIEAIMGQAGAGDVDALIIGIGVNILAPPEEAIALAPISKGHVAIHPFRDQVLAELKVAYLDWRREGFGPVRERWLAQAHNLGRPVRAALPDRVYEGIFKDLDKNGALVLTLPDGTEKLIHAGDIFPA
jgi:BirA family transcriptional regulator, biotin operon repressor / biotin---[acetyl-CoA-carboxylase] ligase